MQSDQHKAIDLTQKSSQSSPRRRGSVPRGKDALHPPVRTDVEDSAKKPSPLIQMGNNQMEVGHHNHSVPARNEEFKKGHYSVLDSSENRPRDVSNASFQGERRTVPWLLQSDAHGQKFVSPPMTAASARRHSSKTKSSDERASRNWSPDEGKALHANDSMRRPKNAQVGADASPSQSFSRPRLKLNGPKLSNAHQQDPVLASYTPQAKHTRSPPTKKADLSIGSRVRELGPTRPSRPLTTLSTEVGETHTTESDSDDASVRMQRSIYQVSAMYSKEPLIDAEPQERLPVEQGNEDELRRSEEEATSTHGFLVPGSATGSPELGERIPAVHGINDRNVVSKTRSGGDGGAPAAALPPEPDPSSEAAPRYMELERLRSSLQPTATETLPKDVIVVDELQECATEQGSTVQGLGRSNGNLDISPNVKLLEAIFKPLIKEMRAGQEYLMSGFLSHARKDVIECPGPKIDQSLPDPFGGAGTGSKKACSFNPLRRVRVESRVANARNKATLIEAQAVAFESEAQRLPRYNSIVRLRSNVLAPNDKDLRYLPYFRSEEEKDGADAINHKRREELLEGFGNRIKFLPEERKCAEQAEFWREHVEYFLEEVGCTCLDVVFYLLHEEDDDWRPDCELSKEALSQWQDRERCCGACGTHFEGDKWGRLSGALSERKPGGKTLALAGLVCSVFSSMARFSIWHIVSTDPGVQSLLKKTEMRWAAKQKPRRPKVQSLCMLCHVFDCPSHGAYLEEDRQSSGSDRSILHERDMDQGSSSDTPDEAEARQNIRQIVALPERPNIDGQQHRCGFFCVDPMTRGVDILGRHRNGEVKGSYNNTIKKAEESGDPGYADGESCSDSCFWDVSNRFESTVADIIHSDPDKRLLGWSQKDIILYRSMLAACIQARRGPCVMAIMLARPCNVIFGEMLFDIHIIAHPVSQIGTKRAQSSLATSLTNGYKDKHYWSESSQTYDHHKRRPFVPCSHSGQCHKNPECTCWTNKVACEWICGCDRGCGRRFQGCRCTARGAKVCFKDSNCDCWVLNRECDPWLCGKCGVLEVLDPVNRHNESILKGRCKNAMIQRNVPKRTLKAPSEVHGWGLFAGIDIRANDFIGEYKGEVISEAESNRRGLVYHYRGLEYLFRLNKEQEIDSSRAGNKMRFINNSERASNINVYAQTMLCNGVQRIGLFAKRNLVAGEEMFFRYGYPESVTKHFWEKEDLEARGRHGSVEEVDNDTGPEAVRVKGKGIKASAIGAKGKPRKGVGKKMIQTARKERFGGKERHAHFLDDTIDDTIDDRIPQAGSHQSYRPKKRKRPSSPTSQGSTFSIGQAGFEAPDGNLPSEPEAPAGPSSSSLGGPPTEVAESDGFGDEDDEEYEYEDNPSDEDDHMSAVEMESDEISGVDGNETATDGRQGSRTAPSRQDRRILQTAAARAASLEKRRKEKTRESAAEGGAGERTIRSPVPLSMTTTFSNRSGATKRTSHHVPDTETVRPYRGKKRGRPFGWRKGVDFR